MCYYLSLVVDRANASSTGGVKPRGGASIYFEGSLGFRCEHCGLSKFELRLLEMLEETDTIELLPREGLSLLPGLLATKNEDETFFLVI